MLPIAVRNAYMATRLRTVKCSCRGLLHVQRIEFPKDPRCRFTNVQKQLPTPFVVYADCKSIQKPVNEDVDVTLTFSRSISHCLAYKVVSSVDSDFSRPLATYRGEDVAKMFVRQLQLEA